MSDRKREDFVQPTLKDGVCNQSPIVKVVPLKMPWYTEDPFIFAVHHLDNYPKADEAMAPVANLKGRRVGSDFSNLDGWSMYHGRRIPGFPQHPHRGFETISIVRRGFIDHADSLGATARLGPGDVQWMTAGRGIVHAEMFPLLQRDKGNPLELFQLWINLPARDKMVQPHFTMMWRDQVPVKHVHDGAGGAIEIKVIAGQLAGAHAPKPPPHSWAARAESQVGIFSIRMTANATWTLPAAPAGVNRLLYHFGGTALGVAGTTVPSGVAIKLRPDTPVELVADSKGSDLLVLQGRPIGERVVQHGPFVMNTEAEIRQAFADYRRTRFGGWPWSSDDPIHARDAGRFAKHADGKVEKA